MNQYLYTLITCFVFFTNFIFGQENVGIPTPKYDFLFKSIPTIDSNTPEWAVLLYASEPNVYKIEAAFKDFYNNNPYKKSVHGQNYKYFMRAVFNNNYVQEDGSVEVINNFPITSTNTASSKSFNSNTTNDNAKWDFIGPFTTYDSKGTYKRSHQANVYTLEQSISNPKVMLAGCETGASFISLDRGENWTVTADVLGLSGGINAVAIDPSNDQIMYLANGDSLFKSENQGTSWELIHFVTNLRITDISISANNGNHILTAGQKGLYQTNDGGYTWEQIVTDKCWDIERKTDDSNVVFISKTNTKANTTEIWKSIDNGKSFSSRTTGWFSPTGTRAVSNQGARIGVTDADPNRVYVLLLGSDQNYADDVNFLGVYKSEDAGETWTLPYDGNRDGIPDNHPGGPYSNEDWCLSCFGFGNSLTGGGGYDQGFYNASIAVSDNNPDDFLVGMLSLFKSNDSGASFTPWGGYNCSGCLTNLQHPDIQEIEINGNDVWVASDGGIDKYDADFNYIETKMDGIDATENWGFGQGWNEDIIVGGRYHNGNAAYRPSFKKGNFVRLGGGESPTGYVSADSKVAIFSDINDKIIPNTISEAVVNAPINVSMHPNQHHYDISKRSELVNDPRYNNVHYIGKDNKLWKTENAGISYHLINEFGSDENNLVQGIEIPRDNPNVMYVTQYIPKNENKIWKTINGGNTWTELKKPEGDLGNYILIQVSEANSNEVYISYANDWNDKNKIFKSTNGGNTWNNITTSTLNRSVLHLIFQNGTDGGVYAVTHESVYYRNNKMTDWEVFNNGLPTKKSFTKLLPFYKDGKLRGATFNRGFVETNLFEESVPVAQPLANSEYRYCSKDTVYFDDYSILKHAGAKWRWNFPGASYVSSNTVRNPKVLYNTPGNYDVSLSITDGNGKSSSKTVSSMIKFKEDACKIANDIGQAISLEKSKENYLYTDDIDIDNVSNFTISAWIKPSDVIQSSYASIFYSQTDNNKICSLNFLPNNNHLGIHWNSSEWDWDSGLVVPKNEWSYVAMVVTPNDITLYLNEEKVIHEYTSKTVDLKKAVIGSYNGWSSRVFDGSIDEVAIWDKALTEEEVRLKRHLIKNTTEPNLKAYYQFNSIFNGEVYDAVNEKDLTSVNNVSIVNSTAPVAEGSSEKVTLSNVENLSISASDLTLYFNEDQVLEQNIYISKLNSVPFGHEFNNGIDNYWIINNYDKNTNLSELTNINFSNVESISPDTNANNLSLYSRKSNQEYIANWGEKKSTGHSINTSAKTIDFTTIDLNSLGQLYLTNDAILVTPEQENVQAEDDGNNIIDISEENFNDEQVELNETVISFPSEKVIPKAHVSGNSVSFPDIKEGYHITIYNLSGKEVLKQSVLNNPISMEQFGSALYIYWLETTDNLYSGKFIIN